MASWDIRLMSLMYFEAAKVCCRMCGCIKTVWELSTDYTMLLPVRALHDTQEVFQILQQNFFFLPCLQIGNWNIHVTQLLLSKLNKGLFALQQISRSINKEEMKKVYYASFHSRLSFATLLWANNGKEYFAEIFKKQKTALRILKYGNRRIVTCR